MSKLLQAKAAYSGALALLTNQAIDSGATTEKTELERNQSGMVYYGFVLQCMAVKFTDAQLIPGQRMTAGVCWEDKTKRFMLVIGIDYFISLTPRERVAVLIHELSHITQKHVFRPFPSDANDKRIQNIAMDLVINQTIRNLPEHACFIKDFKTASGELFPKDRTTEVYQYLLKQDGAQMKKPGTGDGTGKPEEWMPIPKELVNQDAHEWEIDGVSFDPNTKEGREKLEAVKDLLKRGQTKQEMAQGYSQLPKGIEEIIQEIGDTLKKFDAREILKHALRKSIPSRNSIGTWKRPSRRWGWQGKGTKSDSLPSVAIYSDNSGSISTQELQEQLDVIKGFFKNGVREMQMYSFHTSIYKKEKVTKTFKFENIEGGGTDLQCVVDQIRKAPADINIVLTDGCYSDVDCVRLPQTIFIISKSGHVDHPLKRLGKTVHYVG